MPELSKAEIRRNEKQENFRRIAEMRTNKIIESIGSLGNLSNTSYYEYTTDQVSSIFEAIRAELDIQEERFKIKESRKRKFRL